MTTAIIIVGALLLTAFSIPHPGRRILPVYAFIVPAGSIVEIELPLGPPFNSLSSLLGAGVVIAILVHLAAYRDGRVPTLPLAVWMVFLAWTMATALYAIDSSAALDTVLVAIPLVALAIMVGLLPTSDQDLDAVRLGLILSGVAVGLYALFLLASGASLTDVEAEGRLVIASSGGVTDPNILAASLLLPFALSLERLILGGTRYMGPRAWRALGLAGVLLTVFAITITGSRGGLVSVALALILVLWYARRVPGAIHRVRRAAVTVLGSIGAILGLVFVAAQVAPGSRIGQVVDVLPLGRISNTEIGGSGRIEIWTTGALLCREYCAAGSGIGTFPTAFNQVFAFSGVGQSVGADRPAHSIFLELAVELGFAGVTLLILALLAEWRALALADLRRTAAVKAAFVSVLAANLFLSTIWFKYFWLVIVLIRMVEHGRSAPSEAPGDTAPGRVGERASLART